MLLNRMSAFLPRYVLLCIYKQTILPILDYCSIVLHECGSTPTKRVKGYKIERCEIFYKNEEPTAHKKLEVT